MLVLQEQGCEFGGGGMHGSSSCEPTVFRRQVEAGVLSQVIPAV